MLLRESTGIKASYVKTLEHTMCEVKPDGYCDGNQNNIVIAIVVSENADFSLLLL